MFDGRWQRFASQADGWSARFDEATGRPSFAAGAPIPMPGAPEDAVRDLVSANVDLFGLAEAKWQVSRVAEGHVATFVTVSPTIDGIPLDRGDWTFRWQDGAIVAFHGQPLAALARRNAPLIDPLSAIEVATAGIPAMEEPRAERVWAESTDRRGRHLGAAWRVTHTSAHPHGRWTTVVDAVSGEVLRRDNAVRNLVGQVEALAHPRQPADPLLAYPLVDAWIEAGDYRVSTDATGTFEIEAPDGWLARLHGDWLDVDNLGGADGELESDGELGTYGAANATQAEIDTWVHTQIIRDWNLSLRPDVAMATFGLIAEVNLAYTCNAYFDGNIHFYRAGDGCSNTGQLADVIYHEYGHGFHYYSLRAGVYDGSLGEGAADVVAFLQSGDSIIAPGFYDGGGGIRDVGPDRVYPDDYVDDVYYVHSNGLIFAGAMWDLWGILEAVEGPEVGRASIENIFANLLETGPTVAESYDAALLADDDDGDLSNGTPHLCEIIEAFGRHGLGPASGAALIVSGHDPVVRAAAMTPVPLSVALQADAGDCTDVTPTSATLSWRVDSGPWATVDMDISPTSADAVLDRFPDGSFVEYTIQLVDDGGTEVNAPQGGEISPFSFYVGEVLEVRCEGFEESDGGWTHELLDGEAEDGADDWVWGTPAGAGGDPVGAYEGYYAWGTDFGSLTYDGQYQDEKHTRLTSIDMPTKWYDGVFLEYRRWLQVEDGIYDQATIRADGDIVWQNYNSGLSNAQAHHLDNQWMNHSVRLGVAGDDERLQISFDIESDAGLHFGGWNIDQVCLLAPATPDNRLGMNDLSAVPDGDVIRLAWTNPQHAPVTEVVIVRRSDRWPTGPDDGLIVVRDPAPVVGQGYAAEDPWLVGQGFYAVYASDGTDWLSWTVEGFNAAQAVGSGSGDPTPPDMESPTTCGCQEAPSSTMALVALLAFRRRRR